MKRLLGALLVSVVLLGVVATLTDLQFDEVDDTLAALDWRLVALSLLAYAASYVGRGLRLIALMPGVSSLVHTTSISARHIFLAVVMPFRVGEASLPVMLHRECGRPLLEGASVLAVMRVLDLIAVAAYLLLGLALTSGADGGADADPAQVATRAGLALAVLVAGLLLMRPVCRRLARLAASARKPLALLGQLAARVAELRTSQLLLCVPLTLATWAGTYGACWLLLRAMVAPPALAASTTTISFAQSLVGTTGLHLSAVMPISPVAGIGTWETGWCAGYAIVGMPAPAAGASAIVSHVVIFAFIALIGAAGWLARRPALVPAPPARGAA